MTLKKTVVAVQKKKADVADKDKIGIGDLTRLVSEKTGQTLAQSHQTLLGLLATINEQVMAGKVVSLKGVGTFKLVNVKERNGINPQTQKPVIIPAKRKVKFTVSVDLKRKL